MSTLSPGKLKLLEKLKDVDDPQEAMASAMAWCNALDDLGWDELAEAAIIGLDEAGYQIVKKNTGETALFGVFEPGV